MNCINICEPILDLQYQVLETNTYTITIINALGKRYKATLTLNSGDNVTLPMPPLNENMAFRVFIETPIGLEETLSFRTYPYLTILS